MTAARATILETERLTLTTWSPSDVDDLWALHSDPETMRFVRHGRPESREECAELLGAYLAEQASGWAAWRLADRAGRMVGRAGVRTRGGGRELSYTIRRDRWGEGLATEVATALVDRYRRHDGERPGLRASVAVGNPASARVLVKVGFVRCGQELLVGELCDVFRLTDEPS